MSTLNQQRKVVEQLRLEAGIHRRPVSECIRDMIGFIDQYRDKDCLVNGFASKKDNPFQEKGGCQLLWRIVVQEKWAINVSARPALAIS